eukprot:TRINITY_DN16340_c0_g1_i1.p1 TRINITY_DN16340_c0_g1~~TRINITY_DN16340_c0_g1_i1.p1  ORF type:complete len:288 (-),score=56.46 TRINITY_DN16340_c0_g1_i1:224-1087(-)
MCIRDSINAEYGGARGCCMKAALFLLVAASCSLAQHTLPPDHDDELSALRVLLIAQPNSFELNWRVAQLLLARRQPQDALHHLAACLRAKPQDQAAWGEYDRVQSDLRKEADGWQCPQGLTLPGWAPTSEGFIELYKDERCECHKAARAALEGYVSFFEHISIRKGWRQPPFALEDLQDLFRVAAEVVGLVRTRLDGLKRGMALRQIEGSSHDFLWGLNQNPKISLPGQDAGYVLQTLTDLVLATFSDRHGLVESLDKSLLMDCVRAHPYVNKVLLGLTGNQQLGIL